MVQEIKKLWILTALFIPFSGFAGNGKFSVTTEPKSMVHIDGKPIRHSPLQGYSMAPGSHQIRYEAKELGQSVEYQITISADRHLKCDYSFTTTEHRCSEENLKPKPAPKVNATPKGDAASKVAPDAASVPKQDDSSEHNESAPPAPPTSKEGEPAPQE